MVDLWKTGFFFGTKIIGRIEVNESIIVTISSQIRTSNTIRQANDREKRHRNDKKQVLPVNDVDII